MRRRLLNALTALSLLLCVAVCALSVRSYFVADYARLTRHKTVDPLSDVKNEVFASAANGGVSFGSVRESTSHRDATRAARWRRGTGFSYDGRWRTAVAQTPAHRRYGGILFEPGYQKSTAGFSFRSWQPGPPSEDGGWSLTIPLAVPVVLFAILPFIHLVRNIQRRRRHRARLCPQCSYDLRATPDRCPECGAVPAGPASRPS